MASEPSPAPSSGPWRNLYDKIGSLLFENSLEPTPQNFDVCHRYLTASDGELNSQVDRALKSGGLTAVSVASIRTGSAMR